MTVITAVDTETTIEHGVLVDITIDGTTYYVSNCYKPVTYNAQNYQALANFLTISEIQSNISSSNDDIQIGLSGLSADILTTADILGQPIKGGQINIYRAFFNYATQEIISGEVYKRFSGVITNFSIQEDLDVNTQEPKATHTITVIASSILGVLENRYAGRRTNRNDYQYDWNELYFTNNIVNDPSMDRVEALYNATFDFGLPYKSSGTGVNNGNGGTGGTGGSGGVNDNNDQYNLP